MGDMGGALGLRTSRRLPRTVAHSPLLYFHPPPLVRITPAVSKAAGVEDPPEAAHETLARSHEPRPYCCSKEGGTWRGVRAEHDDDGRRSGIALMERRWAGPRRKRCGRSMMGEVEGP